MTSIGLFEAKNRFSEVCEGVASKGEPVVVTRRGCPLVRIVPIDPQSGDRPASVWDTVEEGRARYGVLSDAFDLPERSAEHRPDPLD